MSRGTQELSPQPTGTKLRSVHTDGLGGTASGKAPAASVGVPRFLRAGLASSGDGQESDPKSQSGSRSDGLPPYLRQTFERSTGFDLSAVRLLHDGLAEAHGAQAVTVGREIHLARDHAELASPAGRRLLGHELTHVWQQREASGGTPEVLHDKALESQADLGGEALAQGRSLAGLLSGPPLPHRALQFKGPAPTSAAAKEKTEAKHAPLYTTQGSALIRTTYRSADTNAIADKQQVGVLCEGRWYIAQSVEVSAAPAAKAGAPDPAVLAISPIADALLAVLDTHDSKSQIFRMRELTLTPSEPAAAPPSTVGASPAQSAQPAGAAAAKSAPVAVAISLKATPQVGILCDKGAQYSARGIVLQRGTASWNGSLWYPRSAFQLGPRIRSQAPHEAMKIGRQPEVGWTLTITGDKSGEVWFWHQFTTASYATDVKSAPSESANPAPAKSAAPAAKPTAATAPSAKPTAADAKPAAVLAQPVSPVAKPTAADAKPAAVLAQPVSPVAKQPAAAAKSATGPTAPAEAKAIEPPPPPWTIREQMGWVTSNNKTLADIDSRRRDLAPVITQISSYRADYAKQVAELHTRHQPTAEADRDLAAYDEALRKLQVYSPSIVATSVTEGGFESWSDSFDDSEASIGILQWGIKRRATTAEGLLATMLSDLRAYAAAAVEKQRSGRLLSPLDQIYLQAWNEFTSLGFNYEPAARHITLKRSTYTLLSSRPDPRRIRSSRASLRDHDVLVRAIAAQEALRAVGAAKKAPAGATPTPLVATDAKSATQAPAAKSTAQSAAPVGAKSAAKSTAQASVPAGAKSTVQAPASKPVAQAPASTGAKSDAKSAASTGAKPAAAASASAGGAKPAARPAPPPADPVILTGDEVERFLMVPFGQGKLKEFQLLYAVQKTALGYNADRITPNSDYTVSQKIAKNTYVPIYSYVGGQIFGKGFDESRSGDHSAARIPLPGATLTIRRETKGLRLITLQDINIKIYDQNNREQILPLSQSAQMIAHILTYKANRPAFPPMGVWGAIHGMRGRSPESLKKAVTLAQRDIDAFLHAVSTVRAAELQDNYAHQHSAWEQTTAKLKSAGAKAAKLPKEPAKPAKVAFGTWDAARKGVKYTEEQFQQALAYAHAKSAADPRGMAALAQSASKADVALDGLYELVWPQVDSGESFEINKFVAQFQRYTMLIYGPFDADNYYRVGRGRLVDTVFENQQEKSPSRP